jgi:hypothetical protein
MTTGLGWTLPQHIRQQESIKLAHFSAIVRVRRNAKELNRLEEATIGDVHLAARTFLVKRFSNRK